MSLRSGSILQAAIRLRSMQATSFARPSFAQTAVVSLATLGALALLVLVLAYWTWAWAAPRAEPRSPAPAHAGAANGPAQAAYGVFGKAPRERSGAAPAPGAVRLLGIVAASGGRDGYALLRIDGKKTLAVTQGGEVEPGLRLAEVHAGHIVLERGGARETLAWPEKAK